MLSTKKGRLLAGVTAVGVVGGGLTIAFAGIGQASSAPPGDNGDVKIHNSTTSVTDPRNEPHVCSFYLDGFNFDPSQSVTWEIKSWPPTGNRTVVLGPQALTMDSSGDGHTGDMTLPNGHYKLFWNFSNEKGRAKQKVFWVDCPSPSPSPSDSPSPSPSDSPSPSPSDSPSPSPSAPTPSPSPSSPAPAPAPTPVQSSLPVTG